MLLAIASAAMAETSTEALLVSAGGGHACAVMADGAAQCWGANQYGQLGDGTTVNRLVPVVVVGLDHGVRAIAAGGLHTCALLQTGGIRCWGRNDRGQLGGNALRDSALPIEVQGVSGDVTSIVAGDEHSCALSATGSVMCWGRNDLGQLGNGTTSDSVAPVPVMGLESGVVKIAAGASDSNCAIVASNSVRCWSYNFWGMLGDGTTMDRSTPVAVSNLTDVRDIAVSQTRSCALTGSSDVYCWGDVDFYQANGALGVISLVPLVVTGFANKVIAITTGFSHNCAVEDGGGVQCWGDNLFGQLGDGTLTHRQQPVSVVGLQQAATGAAAGGGFSCAVLIGGAVECWGANYTGELGTADRGNRHVPAAVRFGYMLVATDVIEYYNAALNRYFMTLLDVEIAALDTSQVSGWARTGHSFKAYPLEYTGTFATCRFYIPPSFGDSHFFSASAAECDAVNARFPEFIRESSDVMYIGLPDSSTGDCADGSVPVYRLWSNQPGSDHRYTTELAVKTQMISMGWVPEGYGPDSVAMCAPK